MNSTLFAELKKIGIDEELAARVSASLEPDYNASKKDILVMQEAIMQVQVRSDARCHELNNKVEQNYHELNSKITDLKSEMHHGFANIRSEMGSMRAEMVGEMASMNRQYLITFGGLISTIIAVFLVNLYFHHYRSEDTDSSLKKLQAAPVVEHHASTFNMPNQPGVINLSQS